MNGLRESWLNEERLTAHERDYMHRLQSVTYAQLEEEMREAKAAVDATAKVLASTIHDQYNAFLYYNSAEHGVVIVRPNAFPVAMRRSKTLRRRSSSGSRRSSSHSVLRKFRSAYEGAVGIRNRAEHHWFDALKRYFILMSFRSLSMAKNMYNREVLNLADYTLGALNDWADQRVLTGRPNIEDRRRNYDDALDREDRRLAEIRHWGQVM